MPVLKALARTRGKHDVKLGLWCDVVRPGTVRVGDAVGVSAARQHSARSGTSRSSGPGGAPNRYGS